jgi:hypothetical protein
MLLFGVVRPAAAHLVDLGSVVTILFPDLHRTDRAGVHRSHF